ncbi:MAG: phosphoglycerate kinase [Chthoniobacter sp.]
MLPDANTQAATDKEGIPAGWEGLDSGPASRALFAEVIARAKTIIWNGPPGGVRVRRLRGQHQSHGRGDCPPPRRKGAISVVGGGDTATAAKKFGVIKKVTHASTGGGASLELLEGKILPGVAALNDK